MQPFQRNPNSAGIHLYHQQQIGSNNTHYQALQNNPINGSSSQRTNVSLETSNNEKTFYTLESSQATNGFIAFDSSNNRSHFPPQVSHRYTSNNITNGLPMSVYSSADNDSFELRRKLKELENSMLSPDSDIVDSCQSNTNGSLHQGTAQYNWYQIEEMIPNLDLKEELIRCAKAVSDGDSKRALGFMNDVLANMVSVSGSPIERLGAYMLEGLRARLESSGSAIYNALKCEEPTSGELMSSMHFLYQICPYWKFGYISSNAAIYEAMQNESRIHIIDFQIAQGTQWMLLLKALKNRPGGPPFVRVTGIDDLQSFHARGGGLHIVGKMLADYANTWKIPFEFNSVAIYGCGVQLEDFAVQQGEALAVNFPFALHHIPDESVSVENHRDRLLRLVKNLSPKVVLFVEQESNTNTSPFFPRFVETLNYYSAMFESIDVDLPRDDKKRINAEQHCVARDIVNIIACEGAERVERHELFGKWRARFSMAGFVPLPLSPSVIDSVRTLLKDFNGNFRIEQTDVAIYLAWKNKAMCTSSAWRCYL